MPHEHIKLNFINRSNDVINPSVIIFQKNVATNLQELSIAWQVIKNCGHNDNHPFVFPMNFSISANDAYGNSTPQISTDSGDVLEMFTGNSGDVLQRTNAQASDPNEVDVLNNLTQGSIGVGCYKDGKLLAKAPNIAPSQKAVFEFHPKIYIGVVSQIDEGDVIDRAILANIDTELDLTSVISADIVMTGGGIGKNATPFQFTLEHVEHIA